ncbi:MAG TPA: hypothetical protein DIW20_08165, partial [Rhodospirillaceae bacterium]|nr:hypothetical protein [Rhodospirillaceae bacterium]
MFILPLFFASGILATLYCEAWGKGRLATYAGATFAMVATLAILLAAGSDNSTLAFLLAGLSLLSFHVERRQNTQANDLFWQSAFNAARVIFTTVFWLGLIFFIAWFALDFLAPPHKNKIIGTAVWIFFFTLLGLALVFQSLSLFTKPRR